MTEKGKENPKGTGSNCEDRQEQMKRTQALVFSSNSSRCFENKPFDTENPQCPDKVEDRQTSQPNCN